MTGVEVAAVAVPVGTVLGWLGKHLSNGKPNGKRSEHQTRVEMLLENIEKHTADIPLLRQVMEQHEAVTAHAREQLAEMSADMKAKQRGRTHER